MPTPSDHIKPQTTVRDDSQPLVSMQDYKDYRSGASAAPAADSAVSGMLNGFGLHDESASRSNGTTDGAPANSDATTAPGKAVPHDARTVTQPVKAIDPSRFSQVAEQVLQKIDPSGAVSKDELARAMQNPQFTGEQAQVLVAMYKNFDALQGLAGDKKHEITAKDLEQYQKDQKRLDREQFGFQTAEWALANLANGKKQLTGQDIQDALQNPKTSSDEKHALIQLNNNWKDFSTNGVITAESLKNCWYSQHSQLANDVVNCCANVAHRAQSSGVSETLYGADAASKTDPKDRNKAALDSIKQGDIKQGETGDCYFEASLCALAKSNPQAIKDMITEVKPGVYSVKFPGADKPIDVTAPTEAELGLYNGGSKNGYWASVLEKAFGEYREQQAEAKAHKPITNETPQDYLGDHPQWARDVFHLLTGKNASVVEVNKTTANDVEKKLEQAFKSHSAVSATIDGPAPKNGKYDETPDHFAKDHEYTITGYTPGKDGGTVTIRNPWDRHDGSPTHATVTISLSQFMKDFNQITIAA
jgi:hypothetical protein